jgi:indole-3-glycerol phosphate synthase
MNFLDKIRHCVEKRVALMPDTIAVKPNTLDFLSIFQHKPVVISEIKFASPSRGVIYHGTLDHVDIATRYLAAGAAALSVLTEPDYFKGHMHYVSAIRHAHPTAPILLKDFILSKKQMVQGLLQGANAILLIVAFLKPYQLKTLYDEALLLGLTPMIEVHSQPELEQALDLSPVLIGINNRNLTTLEVNLDTAKNLIPLIPKNCYAVCESGIHHATQMRDMTHLGFDGFLIGSSLMQYDDPGLALQQLLVNDES